MTYANIGSIRGHSNEYFNLQYHLDNINDNIFNSLTWYTALSISKEINLGIYSIQSSQKKTTNITEK